MNTKNYRVGSVTVEMTEEQAARWNAGQLTEDDDRTIMVWVPDEYAQDAKLIGGEVVMMPPELIVPSHPLTLEQAWDEWEDCLDGETAELDD